MNFNRCLDSKQILRVVTFEISTVLNYRPFLIKIIKAIECYFRITTLLTMDFDRFLHYNQLLKSGIF